MRNVHCVILIFFSSVTLTLTGCGKDDGPLRGALVQVFREAIYYNTTTPWDEKHQWKAEDFFDDPKIIVLCKAIEANDLREIDRLVVDGADVNTKGVGNMTPLLWALPENRPEVFLRLLEHGADPNVVITSHINPPGSYGIESGHSVLHLTAETAFPNYFKYVMQHGGDPNLIRECSFRGQWFPYYSPLMAVVGGSCSDKQEAIRLLVDAGADLECVVDRDTVLLRSLFSGSYSIALQLLEAGASFNYCLDHGFTPVHAVVRGMSDVTPPEEMKYYTEVLAWLRINGADIEGAKRDNEILTRGNLSPARIAELKQRYADELAAKAAAREQAVPKE